MAAPEQGTRSRVAVVANAAKAPDARLRRVIEREAARGGWDKPVWHLTTPGDDGQAATRAALSEGAQLVLAAGGDGTVRAVAEALLGTGVPLGIVPLGTGNLFIHNLDAGASGVAPVMFTVSQAVRTAFSGRDWAVDAGVIELVREDGAREEHVFLVMAGIGIDAQMIANTKPELKKRLGVLAYIDAIARSMQDARQLRVHLSVDGAPERTGTLHSLLVGNCGYLPGNIPLLPDALLDDGVLDIASFRPGGFFGWLRLSVVVLWQNAVLRRSRMGRRLIAANGRVRGLRYEQATRIAVRLEQPDEIELDGDHFGQVIGFAARAEPGALVVRVGHGQRLPTLSAVSPASRSGSRGGRRARR